MKSLNITNRCSFDLVAKLVNLMDVDVNNKLSVNHVGTEELGIFYITYDDAPFYLVVDDVKGFIEENSGAKYLTASFFKKNSMYDRIWKKIANLCGVKSDFNKDYSVIMFESDDKINGMVNINTMTIIIKTVFKDGALYFPQVCLNYCLYQ